jgi:DNA-binding NarL/FixJ family response regulator
MPMTHGALAKRDRLDARNGDVATVVIADDNDHFRAGMVRALERRDDLELIHAVSDGAQALEVIRTLRPDVALIDARMPLVDGLLLTRTVRAEPALATTRIILLSARADAAFAAQALDAGAVGFLDKSRSRRDICDAVMSLAPPSPDA